MSVLKEDENSERGRKGKDKEFRKDKMEKVKKKLVTSKEIEEKVREKERKKGEKKGEKKERKKEGKKEGKKESDKKKDRETLTEKEHEENLKSVTIKYSVHNICCMLLSCLQVYFLDTERVKFQKESNVIKDERKNEEGDNEKDKKDQVKLKPPKKNSFLEDYKIYYTQQNKNARNESTSSSIPIYKQKS